jgi:hypothetical protein
MCVCVCVDIHRYIQRGKERERARERKRERERDGAGCKDGEALGGSRKGMIEPVEVRAQLYIYTCIHTRTHITQDGEALGGSRKGIIEPVEVRAQPEGLGLGAVPKEKSPPGD